MAKNTIRLNESQLRSLIKESVVKAVNEISSDMIARASRKFNGKYGYNGSERDNLEKDANGNPLHPKDKKTIASHLRNFTTAFSERNKEEQLQNPIVAKAQELYDEGVDWEKEVDDIDGAWANGYIYAEVQDENGEVWNFQADCGFNWEGDWVPEWGSVEEVYFNAPDGTEGTIPRP